MLFSMPPLTHQETEHTWYNFFFFPTYVKLFFFFFFSAFLLNCQYNFVQEFFIRHMDGTPISSEAEKERVILCLQAAIERRASQVFSYLFFLWIMLKESFFM